ADEPGLALLPVRGPYPPPRRPRRGRPAGGDRRPRTAPRGLPHLARGARGGAGADSPRRPPPALRGDRGARGIGAGVGAAGAFAGPPPDPARPRPPLPLDADPPWPRPLGTDRRRAPCRPRRLVVHDRPRRAGRALLGPGRGPPGEPRRAGDRLRRLRPLGAGAGRRRPREAPARFL